MTRETEEVPWADFKELRNTVWHLYLLHWDEERKLLFINSSNNDSVHETMAKAVAGESAALIRGTRVYRSMHGIRRLVPSIVGLKEGLDRNLQFMMLAGVNVGAGFDSERSRNKVKSNVFGRGYEGSEKVSVGCSMKGRIWSHLIASDMVAWTEWCHHVGGKLIDESINIEEMFKGFLIPMKVAERPRLVPLAIEWPAEFWQRSEESVEVRVGESGHPSPFVETALELTSHERESPIRFRVATETGAADYEVRFGAEGTRFLPLGAEAWVSVGRREARLSEWFRKESPKIFFERDAALVDDELYQFERRASDVFPAESIEVADWSATNIRKESQGLGKDADSVQRHVIDTLLNEDWDVVFDDDDAYEAADVIAMRTSGDRLQVRLYHCKYSSDDDAGARVGDLYALCGQAQKSVRWREDVERLARHVVNREKSRIRRGIPTRFERGDLRTLSEVIKKIPWLMPEFAVVLVQPGVSKSAISQDQLELLAATKLYLLETMGIGMKLIASR